MLTAQRWRIDTVQKVTSKELYSWKVFVFVYFFTFYICVFLYFCTFIFVYFCIFIKENAQLEWTSLSIFFNGSFNSFFCVWLLISLYLCLFQSSPTSLFCLSCFTDFAEELPHGPGPTNLMDYARDHHKETHLVTIIIICK